MDRVKRRKLEDRGWRIGDTSEFLDLKPEEVAFIELKLALSGQVKKRRQKSGLSQVAVANMIGSSQSRVAKMESGDPSVSLDLLVRSLLVMGATRKDLARTIHSC